MRIVQQALYLEVADRLRAMIDEHTLVPGAWIDEAALATTLGISRTPLREALKVLAAEGLVRLEPRRGCFVNELSEQDLDEIFPLMALLEGRCAYEAARNATAADLDALEDLHRDLARYARAGQIEGQLRGLVAGFMSKHGRDPNRREMNRPGSGGGSHSRKDESRGSTEEVQR